MMLARPRPNKPWVTFNWGAPAVIALAICFQIQTNLTIGENTIRVSAADLLSPLLAVFILLDVRHRGLSLPSWRVPRLWLWLGALTAVMTAALIVGRVNTGAWIPWAVYNKYLGWFALVWYFVLGGWFACHGNTKTLDSFVRAFLIGCCAISLYSLLDYLAWFGVRINLPEGTEIRFLGFMKNPNAFGLLVAMALAMQMPFVASGRVFSQRTHILGTIILLVALFFSFSRSAWIGAALALLLAFIFKGMDRRRMAVAFAGAGFVCALMIFVYPVVVVSFAKFLGVDDTVIAQSAETSRINFITRFVDTEDEGLRRRVETSGRAIENWRQNPIIGIGLGGFLWPQLQRNEKQPVILHSTYLWLLVEFGLTGILVFLGFFVVCTYALVRRVAVRLPQRRSDLRLLPMAALGAIAVFAGASIGMEAMYQRHFWFFVGWALALPAVDSGGARQAEPAA